MQKDNITANFLLLKLSVRLSC